MEKALPKDAEKLFCDVFTLIGESLIDDLIENRKQFEKAQGKIGKLLASYKVENFEYFNKKV